MPKAETQYGVVLLVEDSPADARLAREALEAAGLPEQVHVAVCGEDALTFLHCRPPYEAAPRPDLVLLDLNLPGIAGIDVLEAIRADERLHDLVVVVLSTSSAPGDIEASYRLNANGYVTKPLELEEFEKALCAVGRYWLSAARRCGGTRTW